MSIFQTSKKILGMNARNLHFISRFNSHANKKFADNKIFTKHFLESRGIGVAKMFQVIKSHTQLTPELFESLPDSFVIKPNQGFGGAGILVIVEKKKKYWRTPSGKKITTDDLYRLCIEILEGKYSISGVRDSVIFEERLEQHAEFEKLTTSGLSDVRVIVFNNVPVMAMIRVPTEESDGKANMELGAIGMGIDMGNGKTTGAAYFSTFLKKLPNGQPAVGFQIPFWDEILLSSSRIQSSTKIGYLGVDFVVSKTGVKVLEVNARPGLKIQVANRTPLKHRLNKISDLKIHTAEEGVEIAKTLFSEKKNQEEFIEKPVIGAIERVILNKETPETILAKIDLAATINIIHKKHVEGNSPILDITIASKRLKIPFKEGNTKGADLILAGKFLGDFFIDPNKKLTQESQLINTDVEERKLKNVDEKLAEIDEQLKLLKYINPRNQAEQKELFLSHPDFVPRFSFREMDLDLDKFRRDLKKIPTVDHVLFPLFQKKIESLEQRISLLESIGTKDFQHFSEQVFTKVSESRYREAVRFLKEHHDIIPDESPLLDAEEAKEKFEEYLKEHKLSHWNVKLIEDSVADAQITKKGSVLVRKDATFTSNRLEALLVHEIGTHVFRLENGKKQPFKLFARGTANYLQTEEGLAVYNQNQLDLNYGTKFLTPALLIVAIYLAGKMGFRDLFNFLKNTYELDNDLAWKLCTKAKRGTGNIDKPGAFTKDAIYFLGWKEVQKFIDKGHDTKELYIGKVSISDLKLLKKFKGMVEPKFLV